MTAEKTAIRITSALGLLFLCGAAILNPATPAMGFGLKVTPAGNRIYVLQYRINGRLRRYTIGKHGSPWSPDEARTEAEQLRGLIAKGTDPAQAK